MKIAIISDLHLDHYRPGTALDILDSIHDQVWNSGADVLLNAGDIADGFNQKWHEIVNDYAEQAAYTTYQVEGNHDFYGRELADNMRLEKFGEHHIAIGTLWTDCHQDQWAEWWFQKNMPDSEEIKNFSIAYMKSLFESHKKFIFENNPKFVMTHNPPTFKSVSAKYEREELANKAFIPVLGNEIADSGISLWVCGHVHHKHSYQVNNTKVVCNPLGYPNELYRNPMDYKIWIEEID